MNSVVEDIKSRISIVDFIGQYLRLTKAGANWKALCPFHNEKTPSFMVHEEKQIWHCFGCFPKGTLIKQEDELVPIEKIKKGDSIISGNGEKRTVLFKMRRDYNDDLVNIRTRKCNIPVSMTADHEVFAIKTENCKQKGRKTRLCQSRCKQNCPDKKFLSYKIEKFPARNLARGDYLIYPIIEKVEDVKFLNLNKYLNRRLTNYGPKIKKITSSIKVNENLLKLLGYYIAEGSSHRAYVRFSLGSHEKEFAEEIKNLIKKIFGFEASIHFRSKNKTGTEITCCNSNLANIFENLCGKGAENKHIPFKLNYINPEKQKVILGAIFKGDGYNSKGGEKARSGERQITTVSHRLASQLRDILLRLKFQPGFDYSKAKKDKKGINHKNAYTIRWREDLRGNYTDFTFYNGKKYWLLPVRNISKSKFKGTVFNLTVKKDHSYIADHFAVGNCGKGGDIFGFLMEMEGLEFKEALKVLADKAGVELPRYNKFQKEEAADKNKILEILELAAKFYETQLWKGMGKDKILNYLRGRGLKSETIKEFRAGYAPPGWRNLLTFLTGRGYNVEDIAKTGLLVEKNNQDTRNNNQAIPNSQFPIPNSNFYDRFRDRITFPISDIMGKVIGFSARVAPGGDESQAKYVNTPETAVYHKSRALYGIDRAKKEIKDKDETVLVEGNMDVMAAHQAGIKNTVAVSGTALTSEQLETLKRYSQNLKMFFDMDPAGQSAARRSAEIALEKGLNIYIIESKEGKDAADIAARDPALFTQAVSKARPAMEYFLADVFSRHDKNNSIGKKKIAAEALEIIKHIGNEVERSYWLKKLAEELEVKFSILADALKKALSRERNYSERPDQEEEIISEDRASVIRRKIAGLMLAYPEAWKWVAENCGGASYLSDDYNLQILLQNGPQCDFEIERLLVTTNDEELKKLFSRLAFENRYQFNEKTGVDEFGPERAVELAKSYIGELEKEEKRKKMESVLRDIKKAEKGENKEELKILMEEFNKLSKDLT